MGVGGMVGGGIFSVLGLAMAHSGHAAPLAFLLIFAAINSTAFLLRREIAIHPVLPMLGAMLALVAWVTLMRELFAQSHATLYWLLAAYAAVAAGEFLFSQRGFLARRR